MRIPFIPKVERASDLQLEAGLLRYIRDSRGGSAFLLAGAFFWFVVGLGSVLAPPLRVELVLYGGLTVPIIGMVVARVQGARLFGDSRYSSLAALAVVTELAALPVMFFLRDSHPAILPAILMITDGAHLVIYMWLHLDYTYFIAANLKVVLGVLFLFGMIIPGSYAAQGVLSGAISLTAGLLVYRDSSRTLDLYLR